MASYLTTLKELRANIQTTTNETGSADLIDSFINLTAMEIHNASAWTWLRDKQTFSTVASQENYNLDSEVDRIALIRQLTTPRKLIYLPDHLFYKHIPNPENQSSGTPYAYRLWEETGFVDNLDTADTVYISSNSTSDTSSFKVQIVGRNSSGEVISETLSLNGTTAVTSTTTFAASGLRQVSKSAQTTGTITVYDTTSAGVLAEMEPDNLAPRYKRISLYPIPSAAITMYYEYYQRYRYLVNDTDVPQMDAKWNWILREGTLAKMWEWKQNDQQQAAHQALFDRGLRMMKDQDDTNMDYVPVLQPRVWGRRTVKRYADSVSDALPQYSVGAFF